MKTKELTKAENWQQSVLFVTNRPNYCHKRFAEVLGSKFFHVKHYIPENIPVVSSMVNGYMNSKLLPEYDIYFSESIMDYYPVYYKSSGKKIILLAEDTLFKLSRMDSARKSYILKLFRSADGFMAISDLCKQMVLKYVTKPVRVAYPFPHTEFFGVKSDIESKNVLFIGRNDKTKGFMELVDAIKSLRTNDKNWNLYLIGQCSNSVKAEPGIHPLGFVRDVRPYMQKCAFFVQPAQFDACPATVFEAMNAGMIAVISNHIGQTKIFRDNGLNDLILESTDPKSISEKLLQLSERGNERLSRKLKNLSMQYREPQRLKMFKDEFSSLLGEIR